MRQIIVVAGSYCTRSRHTNDVLFALESSARAIRSPNHLRIGVEYSVVGLQNQSDHLQVCWYVRIVQVNDVQGDQTLCTALRYIRKRVLFYYPSKL